jgi:4-hydroxybenzoate polyprenyltransferase
VNILVLSRAWKAVRGPDWWAYKIPPLLATAYAGLVLFGLPAQTWRTLAAALSSIVLIAVYGYVLNDVCDVEADRLCRRPNRMASVGTVARIALLAVSAVGALSFAWLPGDPAMVALAGLNLVLPTLYSVPPLRFKGRRLLGVLTDASGAHAVPMALVARAVTLDAGHRGWVITAFVATAIGWALFAGTRGIIVHQVLDLGADRRAGVATFVDRIGVLRAKQLVFYCLLPAEVLFLAAFLALVLPAAPVAAVAVGAFVVVEVLKIVRGWKLRLFEPGNEANGQYVPLVNNEVYEVWLPFAFALQLAVTHPWLWLLVAAHVILFFQNVRARLAGESGLFEPRRRSG